MRVQRVHAEFRTGLDIGCDTERFTVTDQSGDGRRVDHDFECGDTALLVDSLQEHL